jgi:hypothetical protein
LLDNYDAEDINLSIIKADYTGNNPLIELNVNYPDSSPQAWTLEIIGHRASELSFTRDVLDATILLTDEHPLLWQYSDFQSELYFNGPGTNIHKIVSELNQIDFALFGKYQNSSEQLYALLKTTNGLLSKGSKKLLTKYAECLNINGIKTSMVGSYSPAYVDGKNTMEGDTLKIFLFRGSYIVAQDFNFNKEKEQTGAGGQGLFNPR